MKEQRTSTLPRLQRLCGGTSSCTSSTSVWAMSRFRRSGDEFATSEPDFCLAGCPHVKCDLTQARASELPGWAGVVKQTQVLRLGAVACATRANALLPIHFDHGRREEQHQSSHKSDGQGVGNAVQLVIVPCCGPFTAWAAANARWASREGPIVRFAHDHFHVAGAPPGLMPSEGASWRQCPVCHRRSDRRPPTRRNMRAMAYSKSQRTGNQHPHGHRSRGRKRTR